MQQVQSELAAALARKTRKACKCVFCWQKSSQRRHSKIIFFFNITIKTDFLLFACLQYQSRTLKQPRRACRILARPARRAVRWESLFSFFQFEALHYIHRRINAEAKRWRGRLSCTALSRETSPKSNHRWHTPQHGVFWVFPLLRWKNSFFWQLCLNPDAVHTTVKKNLEM